MLLFANGDKRSLKKILNILDAYEAWYGQTINKEKSTLFMSNQITNVRRRKLLKVTGFSEGRFPITYLGAPVCTSRLKA